MKATKIWNRIMAGIMTCFLLFLSVDAGCLTALAADIQTFRQKEILEFPTGLIPLEGRAIQSEDGIVVVSDEPKLSNGEDASSESNSQWDKYATKYYYNQLSPELKATWDELDALCTSYLTTQVNATQVTWQDETVSYYTHEFISLPENTTIAEGEKFVNLFMASNPQYYFLGSSGFSYTSDNEKTYMLSVRLGIYEAFVNGEERATATDAFETSISNALTKIEADLAELGENVTESDRLKAAHDYIVDIVSYNHTVLEEDNMVTPAEEEEHFTQSAYSAFCREHTTVCAGYTEALQLLCNALDIDAISVTSDDHQWNKVRINDSWYNVDATWADQQRGILYTYYGRSDEFYVEEDDSPQKSSHIVLDIWDGYLPACNQDTDPTNSDEPGTFIFPTQLVDTPEIIVTVDTNVAHTYNVTITNIQEGADVYYTTDGTTPSVAATKSSKYAEPFTFTSEDEDYVIQAVAVLDGYYDSQIAVKVPVPSVKNVLINDHFQDKMTFTWESLEGVDGYIIDVYKGTFSDSEPLKQQILIVGGTQNSYEFCFNQDSEENAIALEAGTNVFYTIKAYKGDVEDRMTSLSTTSSLATVKNEPLSVEVKWHVTTIDTVDYIVLNVEEKATETPQDKLWLWYYSDTNQFEPDKQFLLDMSDGETEFKYNLKDHGISYNTSGYIYITNQLKTTAFQSEALVIGGEEKETKLKAIADVALTTMGEKATLKAMLTDDSKMDNFNYKYQWYVSETSTGTGTAIVGAVNDSYDVQIGSYDEKYYYCEVTTEYKEQKITTTTNGQGEHTRVVGELFGTVVSVASIPEVTYTGQAIEPNLTVTDANTGRILIKGTDYTVNFSNNVNANDKVSEKAKIEITFINDYANTQAATVYFSILPKSKDDVTYSEVEAVTYTGESFKPVVSVVDTKREVTLVKGQDYIINYGDNIKAGVGLGFIQIVFQGNYTGEHYIHFDILPKSIETVTIENNNDQVYTGKPIIPNLIIKDGDKVLTSKKNTDDYYDYELSCTNHTNVGTATVDIIFAGNYTGNRTITFTIVSRPAQDLTITPIADQEYTGYEITPNVEISYGEVKLQPGIDYTASYSNNKYRGTATIDLTFKGNYKDTRQTTFEIVQRMADNLTYLPIADQTYTGNALEPELIICNGNLELQKDVDYTVSYLNNIEAGEGKATITFQGNYTGTKTISFRILPKSANGCIVTLSQLDDYTYSGSPLTPGVTVMDGENPLTLDTDYTIAYTNNTNAGTATVTVIFKGNYTGSIAKTFEILPIIIEDAVIADIESQVYNGSEIIPTLVVSTIDGSMTFRETEDYVVTGTDNKNAGTATIIVTFKGNYKGTVETTFQILPKEATNVAISSIDDQRYTGGYITPKVELKDGDILLVEEQDYTVSYSNHVNVGTAKVTITFVKNYTGESREISFTIYNPVPSTISSSTVAIDQTQSYISNITVGATMQDLLSHLNEREYLSIRDSSNNVVAHTSTLGTGMIACIIDGGSVTKSYTIVVTGDTSGDGKINITDMIAVKAATLKKSTLSGVYEKAGDVNADGKINITDFIKVKAHVLKKDTITGVSV